LLRERASVLSDMYIAVLLNVKHDGELSNH